MSEADDINRLRVKAERRLARVTGDYEFQKAKADRLDVLVEEGRDRIRELEAERDELRRRADNRTPALNEAEVLTDKLKSALERLLHTEADPECSEYSTADLLEAQDQARAALRQSDAEV